MRLAFLLFAIIVPITSGTLNAAEPPPEEPEQAGPGGIGGTVGHGINWTLDQVPFVGGIAKGVNGAARAVMDTIRGREDRKRANLHEERLWQICMADPERYAAPCAKAFPDYRGFFQPGDGRGQDAEDQSQGGGNDVSQALLDRIRAHEGFRAEPGRDASGQLHQFYGLNLDANRLLVADVRAALRRGRRVVGDDCWARLNPPRQEVVAELAYQHGEAGLRKWDEFLPALCAGEYGQAAIEMTESAWYLDTGARAVLLTEIMRTGTVVLDRAA